MRRLLMMSLLISASAQAVDVYPYASVGIGYKLDEASFNAVTLDYGAGISQSKQDLGGNDTALFEVGIEYGSNWSAGLKHDSQWSSGAPFNSRDEYHKTEVFIRYKIGGRP